MLVGITIVGERQVIWHDSTVVSVVPRVERHTCEGQRMLRQAINRYRGFPDQLRVPSRERRLAFAMWRLSLQLLEDRYLLDCAAATEPCDFGDAPQPYPVLLSDDGARHTGRGPMFGTTRDTEVDGQPGANAETDDADEGGMANAGLASSQLRVGTLEGELSIEISGAMDGAYVDGWIDFNHDGNWRGAHERVSVNWHVQNGVNHLRVMVPADAYVGQTYARFRVSSVGGLGLTGYAPDGEVEDFVVEIAPPVSSVAKWNAHQIVLDSNCCQIRTPIVADFDQDRDADIFVGKLNTAAAWLENDGEQSFTERVIVSGEGGVWDAEVVDFDADGDLDVLAVSGISRHIHWYENSGDGDFTLHQHAMPNVGGDGIAVADMDGDQRLDVIVASRNYGIAWYRATSDQTLEIQPIPYVWRTSSTASAVQIQVVDYDADGDLDILSSMMTPAGALSVLSNDGLQGFTRIEVTPNASQFSSPIWNDIDHDGDFDLIVVFDRSVLLWRNDSGTFSSTVQLSTMNFIPINYAIRVADMDGDGDSDVIVAGVDANIALSGRLVAVHLLRNDGVGAQFARETVYAPSQPVSISLSTLFRIETGDVDSDGDLDIITSLGENQDVTNSRPSVFWYENVDASVGFATPIVAGVEEGSSSPFSVVVERVGNLSKTSMARFTLSGSAEIDVHYRIAGVDVVLDDGVGLVFMPGERQRRFDVVPIGNDVLNDHRSLQLSLFGDTNLIPSGPTKATVVLLDDEPTDQGDAPDPYPTAGTRNGARHGVSGPKLGARRDSESLGIPSVDARADDNNQGLTDEDGVVWPVLRAGQRRVEVQVNVRDVSSPAWLSMWIDYNSDGTWEQPNERIVWNQLVDGGTTSVVVPVDVPMNAVSGSTYARVRISSTGQPGPGGLVLDGEVEDYRVVIKPTYPIANVRRSEYTACCFDFGSDLHAEDLDNDGDIDLVGRGTLNSVWFVWQERLASGTYQPHLITTNIPASAASLVVDIDGDGDRDVIVEQTDKTVVFEQTELRTFVERVVTTKRPDGVVRVSDFDNDGDLDVLFTTNANGLAWYRNDGNWLFSEQSLTIPQIVPIFELVDYDRDGDIDIFGQTPTGGAFWSENLGNGEYTVRFLVTSSRNLVARLADFNSDGLIDVVMYSRDWVHLVIYETVDSRTFRPYVLAASSGLGRDMQVYDLDGDSDLDIVALSESTRVYWLENRGSHDFVSRVLFQDLEYAFLSLVVVDLDGDSRAEFLVRPQSSGYELQYRPDPLGDFNWDGATDGSDIDALVSEVSRHGTNVLYDITNDGRVNHDDISVWIHQIYGTLPGDVNLDYVVDVSDWNIINTNKFQLANRWTQGDLNSDGVIDASDFNVWSTTKFQAGRELSALTESKRQIPRAAATVAAFVRRHNLNSPRKQARQANLDAKSADLGDQRVWGAARGDRPRLVVVESLRRRQVSPVLTGKSRLNAIDLFFAESMEEV